MQCTAQFINGTPQVFLLPIIALLFCFALLVAWLVTSAFVMSIGEIQPNPALPFLATVVWTDEVRYAMIYQLFGYLWFNALIIGCC